MWRKLALMLILVVPFGCGHDDDDDVAEVKTPLPMDKVPAVVLDAAKKSNPSLTFFAAYTGKFDGKDSIEMRGKTKSGQVKEIEIAPDGQVLGTE